MPIPWLDTLPKAARLFLPIAESGIAKGLSANSIIEAYGIAKPGIRRKLGLEVVRRVRDVKKKSDVFKYTRKKYHPSPESIPTALTDLLHNYSYKVKYEAITESGESYGKFVTVSSDKILTPGEAMAIAQTYLEDDMEEYEIESVNVLGLEGIKKHPRLG